MRKRNEQGRFIGLVISLFSSGFILSGMIACSSSPPVVNYDAATNPSEAIEHLNNDLNTGLTQHYDVLAQPDFSEAQKHLETAKELQVKNSPQDKVLRELGEARGYLNRAKSKATELQPRAQDILTARSAAIDAGARDFARESVALKNADDALRSEMRNLERGKLTPERWSELQGSYLDIELSAIQDTRLGSAQAAVEGARKNGGPENAPYTFRKAEFELQNARNVIATERHNDEKINPVVEKAQRTAQFLSDVLATTKQPSGRISEEAAIKLVRQNRKITALDTAVSAGSVSAESKDQLIAKQRQALKDKDFELTLNNALINARKDFKPEEADVFREGDKLHIRLRGMKFSTGVAKIPPASMAMLSKVNQIAQELKPEKITVEGHTDSTGDANKNLSLSKERALSVANYFEENGLSSDKVEAIGYGNDKPLETNKTKAGRSANRRVDIIIDPGKQSSEGTADKQTM